jgi:septum formation protein
MSIGVAYSFAGVGIDETPRDGETAEQLVRRLATAKARAALATRRDERIILAADTVVARGGELFGKPASEVEALHMLSRLSGCEHTVRTAVTMLAEGRELSVMSTTELRFRDLEPDEARAYWRTGEPRGKAGAYAIQARGGIFVAAISGSYSGVMGLPVFETAQLLQQVGIDVLAPGLTAVPAGREPGT